MSFSWGSTNNNNNNTSTFSWGSSNNNNNNNSSSGWGSSNNNNNNNSSGFSWGNTNSQQEGSNNNNNNSSFSFGNSNNNNNNNAGFGGWGSSNNSPLNPNSDHIVVDTPSDAISNIQFHPTQPQFIASSWDNTISIWECFGNNQTKKLSQQKHDKPVLDCCYDATGDNVFSVGCDNNLKIWNPRNNNAFANLGQHQAPIRCVEFNQNKNMVITGSWDQTIAFWDPRNVSNNNTKAVFSSNLNQKVYAMATSQNYLVVALGDNDIKTFDLRNGANEVHSIKQESNLNTKAVALKKQVRCIDIFHDNKGYVASSIGGRVIIKHFDRTYSKKDDFSYKCHRHNASSGSSNIFAVNAIKFHQQTGVFATGGDDGEIVTWDKDGRAKLYTFKAMEIPNYRNQSGNNDSTIDNSRMPIVAIDYHKNGSYMLYATSYNWNKGIAFNDTQQQKPQIYLHQVQKEECDKNKSKK